jgi:hypothetical protein
MRYKLLFFIAFSCISRVVFCQGSPPLMTDDSGVPGDGNWENNIGFGFEGGSKENILEGPIIDLNYGVGDHIQLKYEMSWLAEKGENLANKFDAILVGVKYNFSDGKSKDYELALYPQAVFSFNNESGKKIEYGLILPVTLTKEFESPEIGVNGQLGAEILEREVIGIYGFSIGKEINESLDLMAEVHGTFSKAHSTLFGIEHEFFVNQETFVNIGASVKATEHIVIQGAFGKKLNVGSDDEPEFFGYAGLQFLL